MIYDFVNFPSKRQFNPRLGFISVWKTAAQCLQPTLSIKMSGFFIIQFDLSKNEHECNCTSSVLCYSERFNLTI